MQERKNGRMISAFWSAVPAPHPPGDHGADAFDGRVLYEPRYDDEAIAGELLPLFRREHRLTVADAPKLSRSAVSAPGEGAPASQRSVNSSSVTRRSLSCRPPRDRKSPCRPPAAPVSSAAVASKWALDIYRNVRGRPTAHRTLRKGSPRQTDAPQAIRLRHRPEEARSRS